MRKHLLVSTIPAIVCAALAAPAGAATRLTASTETAASNASVSENWAGYVDKTKGGSDFSAASASWREPSVTCTAGESSYSAYWVGLGGGGSSSSDALEQEGTQADCNADGSVKHYAWYELVPSAPVRIAMTVSAGDQMYARTAVSGDAVTVQVDDRTTGKSFKKTIQMTSATPDTSTAEWVAEAPSECSDSTLSDCQVLSLADFGTVKFTDAYATAGGHTGAISDSHFSATPVALESSNGFLGGGYGGYGYSGSSTAGSTGDGQSSSGYGQSGYGESSSGEGDGYSGDGNGDDGSDGYSDGSGWTGIGWTGAGYSPIVGSGQVSDATLVSAAGAAAPSSLADGGTTFSVYYGKAPSGSSSSSLTSSSTGTGSTASGSTGSGSTGASPGDAWGNSGSTGSWGDSGSSDGWSGSDGYSGDSVTIGGYTLSWGPGGLTVSAS
jgi:hypothetical protein